MAIEVNQVLMGLLPTLAGEIPAQLPAESYAQGQLGIVAALLLLSAMEHDRAADTRIWENAELRRIFASAAESLPGIPCRDQLQEASAGVEPDFKMGTLNAANDALQRLLIELHVAVEEADTPGAKSVESEIWSFLRGSAERRDLQLPTAG